MRDPRKTAVVDAAGPGDQSPDDDLVLRARAGDEAAFTILVERYRQQVYRLAFRLLGNAADADDAAQEAFVRAYVHLGAYQPGSSFRAWLLAIAAHWCIDQRRRTRPVSLDTIADGGQAGAGGDDPEVCWLRREGRQAVRQIVEHLPPHYRQIILLRYWHDLTYVELSDALGQPISTVRMRLFRARRRLAGQGEVA